MATKLSKKVGARKAANALDLSPPLKITKIISVVDVLTTSLRKRLFKSSKGSKKGLSDTVKAYAKQLQAAKKRGAYLRAKSMLNSATRPVKAILDKSDVGTLFSKAPKGSKIWLPFKLNQKKWHQTRNTGAIQEMRALIFPDKRVQFDIAGEVKPSISPLRSDKGMDFKDDLPSPSTRRFNGHSLKGYERAHLWGHGFGDEARMGLMYAPKALNQVIQNNGFEKFIRDVQMLAQREGKKVLCKCKAVSHPPKGNSNLSPGKGELLLSEVFYDVAYQTKDGKTLLARFVATVSEPPESKVVMNKADSFITEF